MAAERIGHAHAAAGSAGIAAMDVHANNRINILHHVRLSFSATHPSSDGIEAIRQVIFVPCKDGISHSERENMTQSDAAAGAAVLLRVLCQVAG
jgi:hypothetical protein